MECTSYLSLCIVQKTLYPRLLYRCSTPEAAEDDEHEEGKVKEEYVAPAPLCFGVHAAPK